MSLTTSDSLVSTNFFFKNQTDFIRGKVRDVYYINGELVVLVASDRISAFDHVLPSSIPYKGQVLNQLAAKFLDDTKHIVPNWKICEPDPHVTIGKRCTPFPVEFVVRGYLSGHAWRVYKNGGRELCGNILPEGLRENDKLPQPIITPTTKASSGHDEDISLADIVSKKIIKKKDLDILVKYAFDLFEYGQKFAATKNLILVDTKYEFGEFQGEKLLIDEIHTPDSSRYFYADSYDEIQQKDQKQRQLSKEFVREWLMENNFQGREGEQIPVMTTEVINHISNRYIELYEKITGETFIKRDYRDIETTIENIVNNQINILTNNQ